MPNYSYKGVTYEIATTDKDEALRKIKKHLGISDEPESAISRAGRAAVGGYDALLTMGMNAPGSLASGVIGAAMTPFIGPEGALEVMQGVQERYAPFKPSTEFGQFATEAASDLAQRGQTFAGQAVSDTASRAARDPLMFPPIRSLAKAISADPNIAQFGGEVAAGMAMETLTDAAPMAAAGAMARRLSRPAQEPVVTPPAAQDPVIQRAQEIAASQGRAMTPADIEAAQAVPRMPTRQEPLDFNQGAPAYTPEEILRARQEAAQGELISARESELFGQSTQQGTTPDMFQGTGFREYDAALQAQQLEAARQRTLSQPQAIPFDPYQGELPSQPTRTATQGGLDVPSNLGIAETPPIAPQQGLGFETPEQAALRMQGSQLETTVPPTLGEGLSLAPNNAPRTALEAPRGSLDLGPSTSLPGRPYKGLGGATEQSNMGADLFRPGEDMSARGTSPIPYQATPASDLAAGAVPGFLRSAEELMAAKRLEKAGEPTNIQGEQVTPADIRNTERQAAQTRLGELKAKGKLTKAEVREKKELNTFLKENPSLSTLPPNHPSTRLRERILANDFRGALQVVADLKYGELKGISPQATYFFKYLAKTFLRDENFTVPIKVVDYITPEMIDQAQSQVGGIIRGMFYQGEMTLASKTGGDASIGVFMHEAVHAKVKGYMTAYEFGLEIKGPRAAEIKAHLENLNNLYRYVKPKLELLLAAENKSTPYGLTDIQEFMAEVSNAEFLEQLRTVQIVPSYLNKLGGIYKTAYDAVVGIYNAILGIKGTKEKNAMDALLSETAKLLNAIDKNTEGLVSQRTREGSSREALAWDLARTGDIKAAYSREPSKITPQSKAEYLRDLSVTRPDISIKAYGDALYDSYVEQWKKDNMPINNPIGYDNTPPEDLLNRLFRKNGEPRIADVSAWGPAFPAANKHPLINKVYSQIVQASAARDRIFQELWRGASVRASGFLGSSKEISALSTAKRLESPDSPAALKNKLSETEKRDFMSIIQEFQDKDPKALFNEAFLKARGMSTNVIKLIKSIDDMNKKALTATNAARAKLGLEPITSNDGWLVSRVRFGDFHVFQIDPKTGKHDFLQGFDSLADAEKVSKYLNSTKGMRTTAVPATQNPRKIDTLPTDAYIQAMSLIEPAKKAEMRAVVQEALNSLGIRAHALSRDSAAGGYPGSKESMEALGVKKSFDDMMEAVETWYRQVSNYAGSADARKQMNELFLQEATLEASYPNSYHYSKYMWEQFSGADRPLDKGLRDLSMFIATLSKRGDSSMLGNALMGTSQMFTASALTMLNATFYLANAVQFVHMPARLSQTGIKGNLIEASLKAVKHMQRPDSTTKALMHKFVDEGIIEPKFAEALDWAATADSKISNGIKYAMGVKVAAYADSYARGIAAFMSYEYGKSSGMTDAEATSFAMREAGGAMIIYDRWARMPVLNKLGPIGDTIAPLTSFVSNQAFLLASYIKDATIGSKDKGRLVQPLLLMLGANIALAGVRGLPGYEDMERLYLMLNQAWIEKGNEPLPTPQELMLAYLPDALEYGIPSALAGANMSSTFGMGTIFGNVGETAGLQYAGSVIGAFMGSMSDQTEYQRYSTMASVMPTQMREFLRAYLSDQSPTTPARVLGKDNLPVYERTPAEQKVALATGKTPLNEDRAKKAKYTNEQLRASITEAQGKASNLLADSMITGKPMPDYVDKFLSNYPEKRDDIFRAAEAKVKLSSRTYEQRKREEYRNNPRMRDLLERTHSNVR